MLFTYLLAVKPPNLPKLSSPQRPLEDNIPQCWTGWERWWLSSPASSSIVQIFLQTRVQHQEQRVKLLRSADVTGMAALGLGYWGFLMMHWVHLPHSLCFYTPLIYSSVIINFWLFSKASLYPVSLPSPQAVAADGPCFGGFFLGGGTMWGTGMCPTTCRRVKVAVTAKGSKIEPLTISIIINTYASVFLSR